MIESKVEWNGLIKEYLEENLSQEQTMYLQKMIARDPQLADLYEQMKDEYDLKINEINLTPTSNQLHNSIFLRSDASFFVVVFAILFFLTTYYLLK